jgi:hypothetical protein
MRNDLDAFFSLLTAIRFPNSSGGSSTITTIITAFVSNLRISAGPKRPLQQAKHGSTTQRHEADHRMK